MNKQTMILIASWSWMFLLTILIVSFFVTIVSGCDGDDISNTEIIIEQGPPCDRPNPPPWCTLCGDLTEEEAEALSDEELLNCIGENTANGLSSTILIGPIN